MHRFKQFNFLIAIVFVHNGLALAQTQEIINSEESFKDRAIRTEQEISVAIDDMAERLDRFLSGKNVSKKKNETELRLIGFSELYEGGNLRQDLALDFSLRLPSVEENWQVMLSSTESNDFNSLDSKRHGVAPATRKYGAGVGLVKSLGNFKTLFRPGIFLTDPLSTFYLLQFSARSRLGTWIMRPEFRFFAESEKGTGQSIGLYFDYKWTSSLVFRFINEEQYLDLENLFSTNFGPQLLYSYSERTAMSTAFTFYSINRPIYHLDHYLLSFSIRQDLFKKILYVQLSPSLKFEKLNEFKGKAGFAVTMELVF